MSSFPGLLTHTLFASADAINISVLQDSLDAPAEISVKRSAEILRAIIQVLWPRVEGLSAQQVLDIIPARILLSDAETSLVAPTGTPLFENIARTVTNTLVEVGWFIKDKDHWCISDDGMLACKNIRNVEEIYTAALLLCEEKKQLREEILLTVENAEERAYQQIWSFLHEKNTVEFKSMVVDLLKALNYQLDWIAPPRKKHGHIDLIAYPNPLGFSGQRIKVHIRHHGQAATVEGLRAFVGELNAHDIGLFFSTGGFTDQVTQAARSYELRNVRLISLEYFFQLWVQYYDKLSGDARLRFPIKPIYFLDFAGKK